MKQLQDILYKVPIEGILNQSQNIFHKLDSRNIKKNSLFIAQKGNQFDGNQFISKALKWEQQLYESIPDILDVDVTFILVKNASLALGIISSNFI